MKKAFTLIELLVTIAIIGILATILLVSFTNSKAKSRDSQRKADVQAIAAALDLYNADHNTYRAGHASSYNEVKWSALATKLKDYIDPLPKDPINDMVGDGTLKPFWYGTDHENQYSYAVFNFPTCPCCNGMTVTTSNFPNVGGYCITANLETGVGNGNDYIGKQCGIFMSAGSTRHDRIFIAERHYYIPDTCPAAASIDCSNPNNSCSVTGGE